MTQSMQHLQQMQHEDRRAAGVRRVPVERIVDVCGMKATLSSAFQGWSINVSGRGMSVRAERVPELETPVIVRFQEHGSEVIAEAQVVWRSQTPAGNEFGVRFTALDSRSVQALKALCQGEPLPVFDSQPLPAIKTGALPARREPEPAAPEAPDGESEHDTEPAPAAAAQVKLHIEGLAAPMQARVRQQGGRKMALGSQLEFLRVGRDVEVEGAEVGDRRRARIDEVDVAVDPDSQVPELIVSLCYDTPLPPAVNAEAAPSSRVISPPRPALRERTSSPRSPATGEKPKTAIVIPRPNRRDGVSTRSTPKLDPVVAFDLEGVEPTSTDLPAVATRELSTAAVPHTTDALEVDRGEPVVERARPALEIEEGEGEGEAASDAERLRERLDGVLDELSSAARRAGARCRGWGEAATRGANWVALQARNAGRSALAARSASLPRRTAAALRPQSKSGAPRSTRPVTLPGGSDLPWSRRVPRPVAFGGAVVATVAVATWLGRASSDPGVGKSRIVTPASPAAVQASPASPTVEESPDPGRRPRLLVPPDSDEAAETDAPTTALAHGPVSPGSEADRGASIERRALARYQPAERDFASPPSQPTPSARRASGATAEFGSGRLHLPIVHRLRLDQPGTTLRGERTPTGFDVIIPGRKVLESATGIAKRDARFAKVSTTNGSEGARISFRFRSEIPAYKVRLRNDAVEFFINSP